MRLASAESVLSAGSAERAESVPAVPAPNGESVLNAESVLTERGDAPAATEVVECAHCGTPVEQRSMDGAAESFCCRGCAVAWRIIHDAGLSRYYEDREETPPRPEPWLERWDAISPAVGDDGSCEVRLAVDGLRCASCVWVTENVLARADGVLEATVSYATGRATLRWNPERISLGQIAGRIATLGYRPRLLGSEERPDRSLLTRLGVSAFAAANVMLFSAALYAGWLGPMEEAFMALFRWSSLALATPVALWAAAPFFAGAWSGLRHRVLHMDVPIALAISILYGHGVVGTIGGFDTYLDSLTMLVTLLLAGRVLESGGRRRAAEAATTLAATVPATARRVDEGAVEVVSSAELQPGDHVVVAAGEDVPADGRVLEGRGSLQRALLTGESEPVTVQDGDSVWAGTVLIDGPITMEVTTPSDRTVVRQMADELGRAADRASRPSSSDRIAPWFTAATLAVAALTFTGWMLLVDAPSALEATIAVLVVACPCALALSRPLATAAGLGAAARRGLLFRSGDALLDASSADVALLDKTGTITEGAVDILSATDAHLRVAAALERHSVHPIARAVVREAVARGLPLPEAQRVREHAGVGIEGVVDGVAWKLSAGGDGEVLLRSEVGDGGVLRIGDRIRPDSPTAVSALRDTGLHVVLVSGDHPGPAGRMATALGNVEWKAGLDPRQKANLIEQLQARGQRVLFVGDGLNDGPGLATADVGIAMGTGAASSILVADGVIGVGSLSPLPVALIASRECRRAVRANQLRAIAYNVTAVSAAAAGFINPLVAAVLMPLSSLMVVAGASRIESRVRRWEAAA